MGGLIFLIGEEGLLQQERENKFIAISGNMGVGKTTLSRILNAWGPEIFFKFEEPEFSNPYLPGQYEAVANGEYSPDVYKSQRLFLTYKGYNLLDISIQALMLEDEQQLWLDRTVYEDAEIFAKGLYDRGLMNQEEWSKYVLTYNACLVLVPKPRMLFNIEASAGTCRSRADNDPVRNAIPPDYAYYQDLHQRYQTWISDFKDIQSRLQINNRTRVVRIDTETINLHKLEGQNGVLEIIVESLVEEGLLNLGTPPLPDKVLVPYNGKR